MDKRKFTTKQEREQHIQNFLASGKSQLSWCSENSKKPSTLNKWLHNYRASQQEVKFIPLAPKPNTSHQFHSNEILIEIGVCKMHVPETLGIQFMRQAIKAVSERNEERNPQGTKDCPSKGKHRGTCYLCLQLPQLR